MCKNQELSCKNGSSSFNKDIIKSLYRVFYQYTLLCYTFAHEDPDKDDNHIRGGRICSVGVDRGNLHARQSLFVRAFL